MRAGGKHNKDKAPPKKQELDVWAESGGWHSLGAEGNQVTELVALSSAISNKLVVLTGETLVLTKYLPWKLDVFFKDQNPKIMNAEELFWPHIPQAACMSKAKACSVRARAWTVGKSFPSALRYGRSSSLSQNCSRHTRKGCVGFPAVPPTVRACCLL